MRHSLPLSRTGARLRRQSQKPDASASLASPLSDIRCYLNLGGGPSQRAAAVLFFLDRVQSNIASIQESLEELSWLIGYRPASWNRRPEWQRVATNFSPCCCRSASCL